ncbi:hypothetical protein OS493_002951 [Desmophyllum pertusum]|uniref:PKD domain-containing protein n=1 Tax=Desmophyllum pertusum TaxID=174260 RepID=A0A9W9YGA5_9CNID|nr:hypothetical protein OS493_002951 [Desmophyllum pertusum]
MSGSPDTDGAYVIPSAMMKKDGYILAWEFFASEVGGPIRLQVYRPNCSSANTHFCPRNHSCIPKADNCISPSLFSCPANSVCMGSGRCLSTCQRQNVSFPSDSIPRTDYVIVAETLVDISKKGKKLIYPLPEKAIKVQAGDVIGWVGNTSSGALAFEQTIDDPSFFYPGSSFSLSMGSALAASGGATRYEIKHLLRAHVSQPSQAAVNVNFTGGGIHKVTVIVDNVAESRVKTCEVSVQERIENLRIVTPLTNVSYPTGQKVRLESARDKGSNMSYTWTTNGTTYNLENPEVVYSHTGLYPISVHASNNISSADALSEISVQQPVTLTWSEKPPAEINVGVLCNFSVVISGTNVTVTKDFGDGSSPNDTFIESAQNTVINISHAYTKHGEKDISIEAKNNIPTSPAPLTFTLRAKSDLGDILIQLRPAATVGNVLKIATGQTFELDVSVSDKQPVNYTFRFDDKSRPDRVETQDGDTKVTHKYDTETDYNVTITSSVMGHSENRSVHVIARLCDKTCSQTDPKYSWNISPEPAAEQAISESDKQKASFELEPRRLVKVNYTVTLNISYYDQKTLTEEKYWFKTHIRVVSSPLVADISGGSYREVDSSSTSTQLTINASKSFDPDDPDKSNLNFVWTCKFENNSVLPISDELCNSTEFVKIPGKDIVKFDFNKFRKNVSYTFKVTVKEGLRNHSAQQVVKLLPNIPSLEISCRDCLDKINPHERVKLEGKCTNCKRNHDLTLTTWKLLDANEDEEEELSGNINVTDPELGWNSINLVLKEHKLKRDTKYIAQLTGRRGNRQSTVQFSFQTTSPPENGSCTVSPKSGEAAETMFGIRCENWVTRDNPISYKFLYKTFLTNLAQINTLSTESQVYQLWYFGERSTPSRVLPLGDPQDDFKLYLSARICNHYNCCANFPLNATVTEGDDQNVEESIGKELDKIDAKEDPKKVVQLVNSFTSIINYGNKSDSVTTTEIRTKIRSKLVDKLTEIDLTDNTQAQQTIGALIEALKKNRINATDSK